MLDAYNPMGSDSMMSLNMKEEKDGEKVGVVHEKSYSANDSLKNQERQNMRYETRDLLTTTPPTFAEKIRAYLFRKGLRGMPRYMREIYRKIPRTIYVNQALPDSMKDPSTGHPIVEYPLNKIRTTKYTPLSFLPRNLIWQFTNIANVYFLLMVILGAFKIFGVQSPGLAAVPLIVIVCITALKDAIEEYNRALSDSDLNNSPIHLLVGVENPNVLVGHVTKWRAFKKFCSRCISKTLKAIIRCCILVFAKKDKKAEFVHKERTEIENVLHRVSTVHSSSSRTPRPSTTNRPSMQRTSMQRNSMQRTSMQRARPSTQSRRSKAANKPAPHSLINPQLCEVRETNSVFKNRRWKDICVGDMIRVRQDEEVPADVIILSTSDTEGSCYVETKNLDGETNLKGKNSLKCGGYSNIRHARDLGNTKFWVECDPPNENMYHFRGTIHYENYDKNGYLIDPDEKEAISDKNVMLRGCTLRNTSWIVGLVVYTGSETKIMLNSDQTPTKMSRISRELNFSVIINFVVLFVLCFISGLINGLFYNKKHISRRYFDFKPYSPTAAGNGVVAFFVTLIIYQSLVPISLYISIEIIKTLQAFFIYSDVKMYYPKLDFPCLPKTWTISDDLGQIEYIFSDKTGTLTQNVMIFRKCSIFGKSYGLAYTEAKQGFDRRQGLDVVQEKNKWSEVISRDKQEMFKLLRLQGHALASEDELTFVSSDFVRDTIPPDSPEKESKQILMNQKFMLLLSLCHTAVTQEDPETRVTEFKAESPDEGALLIASNDVGISFKGRTKSSLFVEMDGETLEYELLEVVAFSSLRKRMSCIVRSPEGKIIMITKGADNVIFSRLSPETNDEELVKRSALHLEDYSKEGLRTLCVTEKILDPELFFAWRKKYRDAQAVIDDNREEAIEKLEEEIEQGLTLLGVTAIEDSLQVGVPEAISLFAQAGLKLWVLTGDKVETAINVGFSCNLLDNDINLLVLQPNPRDPENMEYLDQKVTGFMQENFNLLTDPLKMEEDVDNLMKEAIRDHSSPQGNYGVVIDGEALGLIFGKEGERKKENEILRHKFLLLCKQCRSVICCRVSPLQKVSVVKFVKESLEVMTLAIGDGANDVSMIQAAHIGVGIAGEEGRQAVMSSDYALGQFRFLTRLLLVHGRWSYKRLAEMVPCFFYKNVVFTLTCFWYGIYNDFDGSYLYEYTYLMFYNLAFTSLPVIVLAVLDQDVSDSVSLLVPQLYKSGILGLDWSQYKFVWYMIDGVYQSVIAYYFPYLLYYKGFQNPLGLPIDHRFWVGIVVACISVVSCDIYVLLQQHRWDWLTLVIDIISLILVFFWTGVWSATLHAQEFYRAGAQVLGTLSCWCAFFVGTLICILPRFIFDVLRKNFKPKDIDIIRERAIIGEFAEYPEGYDPTDIEDVEKHRLIRQIRDMDPQVLETAAGNAEKEIARDFTDDFDNSPNAFKRAYSLMRRRATITRSRRGTSVSQRLQTIGKLDLNQLRAEMIKEGQYNTAQNNINRIQTNEDLPGLSYADTLMSYHNRNSLNYQR